MLALMYIHVCFPCIFIIIYSILEKNPLSVMAASHSLLPVCVWPLHTDFKCNFLPSSFMLYIQKVKQEHNLF
jgi:hypothetical protein